MREGCSSHETTYARRRSGWYNCKLNEGKTKFKEIGRFFYGKSLQDVEENDISVGIGYFVIKTYKEESNIEDVLQHLDGILDKLR